MTNVQGMFHKPKHARIYHHIYVPVTEKTFWKAVSVELLSRNSVAPCTELMVATLPVHMHDQEKQMSGKRFTMWKSQFIKSLIKIPFFCFDSLPYRQLANKTSK